MDSSSIEAGVLIAQAVEQLTRQAKFKANGTYQVPEQLFSDVTMAMKQAMELLLK